MSSAARTGAAGDEALCTDAHSRDAEHRHHSLRLGQQPDPLFNGKSKRCHIGLASQPDCLLEFVGAQHRPMREWALQPSITELFLNSSRCPSWTHCGLFV